MTHAINQRVTVYLPSSFTKFAAGRIQHVLAGKYIKDLVNSLIQQFPQGEDLFKRCEFVCSGRKLLLDNEVYDGDEIYFQEIKK